MGKKLLRLLPLFFFVILIVFATNRFVPIANAQVCNSGGTGVASISYWSSGNPHTCDNIYTSHTNASVICNDGTNILIGPDLPTACIQDLLLQNMAVTQCASHTACPTPTPTSTPTPTITPTPVCPAAGSNDTKICRNNSLSHSYADGRCGTTTVGIECPGGCTTGSSSCNADPVCPAAGTVLSQSCEGNNLARTFSTGIYELALGMCGTYGQVTACPSGCPAGGTACNPTPTPTPTTIPIPATCDPEHGGSSSHVIDDADFDWWKNEFLGTLTYTNKLSDCKQDNIIDIFDFNKMRDLRWPGLLY